MHAAEHGQLSSQSHFLFVVCIYGQNDLYSVACQCCLYHAVLLLLLLCRFVELDRCAAAAEAGYAVGLFKVLGAETMAKNDLLVGVPAASAVTENTLAVTGTTAAADAAGNGRCSFASCSADFIQRGLLFTARCLGMKTLHEDPAGLT